MMLIQLSVNSTWPFNTHSKVLQADWSILEIDEKVSLNIEMSYFGDMNDGCCIFTPVT